MYISILYIYLNRYLCFCFILHLFDFYLFYFWISYFSFLYAFLFLVFDEIICFLTLFICLYSDVLCCSFLFLFFVCVVTSWFLVFCIFIYSCNYILVFSPFHRVSFVLQRYLMLLFLIAFHISFYFLPVISLFFLSPCFLLLFFSVLYCLLLLLLIFYICMWL